MSVKFNLPDDMARCISFTIGSAIDNTKELLRLYKEAHPESTRITRKIIQMYENDIADMERIERFSIAEGWAPF